MSREEKLMKIAQEVEDAITKLYVEKTIEHFEEAPFVFLGLNKAFVGIAMGVKKYQPEYWKTYQEDILSNIFAILTSKNMEEAIDHVLEDLHNIIEREENK